MERQSHLHNLDQAILCLSEIDVKFGFLRLGPLCNASESNAFSSARCNIKNIKNKQHRHYSLDMKMLSKRGIELLEKYKNKPAELTTSEAEAIQKLETFFEKKGKVYAQMWLLHLLLKWTKDGVYSFAINKNLNIHGDQKLHKKWCSYLKTELTNRIKVKQTL